jgi:hypothetical protein
MEEASILMPMALFTAAVKELEHTRLGSPYQSGRSQHWFKIKHPDAPAVFREERSSGADDHKPLNYTLARNRATLG